MPIVELNGFDDGGYDFYTKRPERYAGDESWLFNIFPRGINVSFNANDDFEPLLLDELSYSFGKKLIHALTVCDVNYDEGDTSMPADKKYIIGETANLKFWVMWEQEEDTCLGDDYDDYEDDEIPLETWNNPLYKPYVYISYSGDIPPDILNQGCESLLYDNTLFVRFNGELMELLASALIGYLRLKGEKPCRPNLKKL